MELGKKIINGEGGINELLGILKSINYDGVINELEIKLLKKWIASNASDSDPRLQEIIQKLKRILEDSVITEEEKKEIIEITDQYNTFGVGFEKNSELIGIVKGILADNDVNLKEIEHLKQWLLDTPSLKGTYFYDRLILLIKTILLDGRLDDEEKQQMKILLTFLLKDNSLSQRIERLKGEVKSHEFIGNQLIELIDDNTIINKIHNESIKQLKMILDRNCSVYAIDSEIVFLSLTLIALLNYDGNYYDYVAEIYEDLYKEYSEQKIEGQIRNIINKYRDDSDLDHRIISLVLKNTIVPKKFLPSFFDFIYDIYRLNFNYSIDPNSDLCEEFSFVYDGIKKGMDYGNDELNLKVTNKTYSLIKTTKDLISEEKGTKALIELSVSILKIIDNYYWSNPNIEIENEYYRYGFENWKLKTARSIQESKNKISIFKSRWEPEYKLNGNKVYISIPNHKVKDYYNYENLKIQIISNNEIIYENDRLDVYDIIGGYRIENKDVLIENPLGSIRYQLVCGEDIIYDSKEKLFRDYMIFNASGNELKNNRDYDGVVILCSKEENNEVKIMHKSENFYLGYKTVKTGDYIKINDEIFNFSTVLTPGLIGKEHNAQIIYDLVERSIYSEVEGIVYESLKSPDSISLIINNTRYRLSELNLTLKKRGLYNNYFIKLELSNQEYDIRIEELEENKYVIKKEFKFIVDNSFYYETEQIKEEEFLVKINYLDKLFTKTVTYETEDINRVIIDDPEIEFVLSLDLQLYKVDSFKWEPLKNLNNYIWIDDIKTYSNLRINGVLFDIVKINDENGRLLSEISPTMKKNYFDLPIGILRSYTTHDYIYLDFYKDDKKVGILKVYCKCFINKNRTSLWYDKDDNKYHGIISYFGKGNVLVKVSDSEGNTTFEEKVESGDSIIIDSLKSFENYKLEVIDKKVGFTLQPNKVLYSKNIKYYSLDDFVGRFFQIYSVDYDQMVMKKYVTKTKKIFNTYLEIAEQINKTEFLGNIYIYMGKKKYIDKVNPVEVEFASDPDSNGQILTYITNEGEMLFNDFANHTILNTLDAFGSVTPIYSYIVNIERKK